MATSNSIAFDISIRPPPTGPGWVETLTPLRWTTLPNANYAADVAAANTGQYGNSGPGSVLNAWCGGALCPNFGDSGAMVHWGGGHQDYYGNEVYAFDLATLTWQRLDEPSPGGYDGPWPDGLRPDGRPASVHSMWRIGCRSMTGELFTVVRETDNLGGGQILRVSRYNLSARTWFNSGETGGHAARLGYGATYDSRRDGVWTHFANSGFEWSLYRFADDAWDDYSTDGRAAGHGDLVYCPPLDMVLYQNDIGGRFWGVDPSAPSTAPVELVQSGSPPSSTEVASVHWSQNLSAFVVYPSRSDELHLLTPPAGDWRSAPWSWERLSTTGTTGDHPYSGATSDKIRCVEWGSTTAMILDASWNGPSVGILLG